MAVVVTRWVVASRWSSALLSALDGENEEIDFAELDVMLTRTPCCCVTVTLRTRAVVGPDCYLGYVTHWCCILVGISYLVFES